MARKNRDDYAPVILTGIKAGKSRADIAEILGITPSAVCHWLRVRGLTHSRQTQPCDDGTTRKLLRCIADRYRPGEVCEIVGVSTGKHWRRWLDGDREIPREAAERIRIFWFGFTFPADEPNTIRRSPRAPKRYAATCLDCGRRQRVLAIDLTHATQPRCRHCGGAVDLSAAAKKHLARIH